MRTIAILAAAALALAGCATRPPMTQTPAVTTVEVKVPVPVSCTPAVPPQPDYPDTAEALTQAPDLFDQIKRLLAARALREPYEAALRAAIAGCDSNTP